MVALGSSEPSPALLSWVGLRTAPGLQITLPAGEWARRQAGGAEPPSGTAQNLVRLVRTRDTCFSSRSGSRSAGGEASREGLPLPQRPRTARPSPGLGLPMSAPQEQKVLQPPVVRVLGGVCSLRATHAPNAFSDPRSACPGLSPPSCGCCTRGHGSPRVKPTLLAPKEPLLCSWVRQLSEQGLPRLGLSALLGCWRMAAFWKLPEMAGAQKCSNPVAVWLPVSFRADYTRPAFARSGTLLSAYISALCRALLGAGQPPAPTPCGLLPAGGGSGGQAVSAVRLDAPLGALRTQA